MRKFFCSAAVIAAAGLMGCQSSSSGDRVGSDAVPVLSAEAARAAGFTAQEVSEAHDLYVVKCAKCHKFYHPAEYSQKEWDMWMRKMSRKSKLQPAQEELLTRYLAEFRGQRTPVPPK